MKGRYVIVDQDDKEVGRGVNRKPGVVYAWRDGRGTIWTPPTAWAYFAVCRARDRLQGRVDELEAPLPMILTCPSCCGRHIDEGEFSTKPHHTHACQHCGMVWRPALIPTVGVRFLPGFKNKTMRERMEEALQL